MDVMNRLARVRALVHDEPKSVPEESFLFRDRLGRLMQIPDQRQVRTGDSGNALHVLSRDDENVHRGLRIDVAKRQNPFVLIDEVGLQLAGDDFTKNTVGHELRIIPKPLPFPEAASRQNPARRPGGRPGRRRPLRAAPGPEGNCPSTPPRMAPAGFRGKCL